MKLSRNDVGVLAVIAMSGGAGMVMFGPWRFVERSVTIESSFEAVEGVVRVESEGTTFEWVGQDGEQATGEVDAEHVERRVRSRVVRVEGVQSLEQIDGQDENVVAFRIREGGESSPIVFLDGVRLEGGFESIPPETIDRVEVLKGEAALTQFGPEASAGVIQIFTKKGGSGS